MNAIYREHTRCRACGATLPAPYLSLGEQPLANAYRRPDDPSPEPKIPLEVTCCESCGLSQLTVVVDPETLYAGYRFRSGASPIWVQHCQSLALRVGAPNTVLGRCIDIGGNDGTMARALESNWGWDTLVIDPSPAICDEIPWRKALWSEDVAKDELDQHGPAELVIAQNVLGHVDDPIGFLRGCALALAPEGRIVVEVPDLEELWDRRAFDTIYHEHLSYWSPAAMEDATTKAGLFIYSIDPLPVHGGSRRYWLRHRVAGDPDDRFERLGAGNLFAEQVEENLAATFEFYVEHIESPLDRAAWNPPYQPRKLVGWGASAKASVYLNACKNEWGFSPALAAIVDETPEKQGLLMPGVHTPIIAPPDNLSDVDILWILSWNNAEAIMPKARARGFAGTFLLTHPAPRFCERADA